nr:hypothetical protein [Tanacetum cinerariifolium]
MEFKGIAKVDRGCVLGCDFILDFREGREEGLVPQSYIIVCKVRGGYDHYDSRGRGVRRGMKRDRVTRDLPTPTQSPWFMSPVANSSKVVDANEQVPDTGDQESSTQERGPRGSKLEQEHPSIFILEKSDTY